MEKLLLVVDDNVEMANSLVEFLGDLVDGVSVAHTVDEAQDLLVAKTFALMTLDINLRGRNASEIIKFLKEAPENPNTKVPTIIISGMVSAQFIEKNKSKFAGVLGKPFQINELREVAIKALNNEDLVEQQEEVELSYFDRIPFLKCKVPYTIKELDEKVAKTTFQLKKGTTPKALFNAIKVDRDPAKYYTEHTNILLNILLALAVHLEWTTDKTIGKLIYAAYLHDIALHDKPHLARINTLSELESKKFELDPHDYKLVFEHPNMAATTMAGYTGMDPDIVTMIRQHHELPNETGFPAKISYSKIIPMSALFTVAHDLADYMLDNPNWNLDQFIHSAKMKFKGPVFLKVLAGLPSLK